MVKSSQSGACLWSNDLLQHLITSSSVTLEYLPPEAEQEASSYQS